MTIIFDLDATVIDSSHRQLANLDGSLDLANWRENCTQEKIMRDSLLPLADGMRDFISRGWHVIICTARIMGEFDYQFLKENGLYVGDILSRPNDCNMADADLKEMLLRGYADSIGFSYARFCKSASIYDDNKKVLKRLASHGILAHDSISLNETLKLKKA